MEYSDLWNFSGFTGVVRGGTVTIGVAFKEYLPIVVWTNLLSCPFEMRNKVNLEALNGEIK